MISSKDIILKIFDLNHFIKPVLKDQRIIHYELYPFGHLLFENIKKEWIKSCILKREEPAFIFSNFKKLNIEDNNGKSNLQNMFKVSKDLSSNKVPFILTDISKQINSPVVDDVDTGEWKKYHHPLESTVLKSFIFANPSSGQQLFYHWQSQRKYWWRKFSCNPGKISTIETLPNKEVNIQMELPCGTHQPIETIINHGTSYFDDFQTEEKELFEVKDGRKKHLPYVIESSLNLESAILTFLCDALVVKGNRQILKLHRKLAPYKVSFINTSDEELKSLAIYLYENLRQHEIFSLFLPVESSSKTSIETQLSTNDKLGIPYTIVLRDSDLQDGLISIRNRDTTLEEKIHISKLTDYVELLLKNY